MSTIKDLQSIILEVLENAPLGRATRAYIVDEVDFRAGAFTLEEFDQALDELRDRGEIRIRNPTEPTQEQVIEFIE